MALDSPLGRDYQALQLRHALPTLSELGVCDIAFGEYIGTEGGCVVVKTHAGSDIERVSWLRRIGAL